MSMFNVSNAEKTLFNVLGISRKRFVKLQNDFDVGFFNILVEGKGEPKAENVIKFICEICDTKEECTLFMYLLMDASSQLYNQDLDNENKDMMFR